MLGCRFSFESYAKIVREKATKCSLKATEILWMLIDICLPKFDLYQGTVALDVLIFFKKEFCLVSGLKFTLSDVPSFLPDNLSGLKNIIFRPA